MGRNMAANCVNPLSTVHGSLNCRILCVGNNTNWWDKDQSTSHLINNLDKGLFMAHTTIKFLSAGTAALAIALAINIATSSSAVAQQPEAQKWFKICAKQADNDVCNVQYRVVASTGQIITSVNLFTVKGKVNRKIFQVSVPTNRLIPAGVAVKIDKNKPNRLPYANCFRDRCTAEVKMDDNLVKALKSGGEMIVISTNFQNKPNPIKISLSGFTAAFDGPPLKQSELKKDNEALQKALQEKAEKARKALEDAQKKATE